MNHSYKYFLFFFISFLMINTSLHAQQRKKKAKHSVIKNKKTVTKNVKSNSAKLASGIEKNGSIVNTNNYDTLPEKVVTILSEFKPQLKNVAKIDFNLASERKDTINLGLDYQIPSQNLSFQYRPISLVPRSFKYNSDLLTNANTQLKIGYGNFKHHFIDITHNFTDYYNNTQVFNIQNEAITGFHHLQKIKELGFNYMGNLRLSNKNHLTSNFYLKNTERYRYGLVSDSTILPNSNFKQNAFIVGITMGLVNDTVLNKYLHYTPVISYERFSGVSSLSNNFIQITSPFTFDFKNKTHLLLDFEYSFNNYKSLNNNSKTNSLLKISPSFMFNKFGSDFTIGVSPILLNSNFHLFPKIEFKRTLKDTNIVLNIGWHANFTNTKFADLNLQNPWISAPDNLEITTKESKYLKLQFANGKRLNYGFSFSLNDFSNLPLFNTLINNNASVSGLFYKSLFEKKASTIQFDANLMYQFSDKVIFENNLTYIQFNSLEINSKPWGILPLTLHSKIAWIPNNKLQLNGNLQYWNGATMFNKMSTPFNLENVFLINASISYHLNKQLSLWAKGDNLLDKSYQRWLYYPPIGLQIMAGVVYSFK
jgi:hypothetical protein